MRKNQKKDENETAFDIVKRATMPSDGIKNSAAVELGRLGGKKGGPARARVLSKEQRHEIAKKAANARWAKKKIED